jgi:hypothetical protein
MTILFKEIGYLLLLYLPVGALVLWFYFKKRKQKLAAVAPFEELKRRPAGESNRLRIEELNEKIDPWLMTTVTVPIILALWLMLERPNLPVVILFFVSSAVSCTIAYARLRPLIRTRACYQLGFQGERYVAEELNQLMADGFRVFHDVPFDGYNMDHILVGPTGVFVVETKTKMKPLLGGKKQYRVIFDGEKLQFPNGWDTDALDQIRRNQKTLSQWLSSATGDRVIAKGIVTIPGWWVERVAQSNTHVVSPKEIRSLITTSSERALTSAEIQRASHQLEQKCKLPV